MIEHFPDVADDLGVMSAENFHLWSPDQRVKHRVCLSEVNTIALRSLSDDTLAQLSFFEKTTVTKKLRRIADLSVREVQRAIRMNAPTEIAYTFLNYDQPDLTNETDAREVRSAFANRKAWLEAEFKVPVTLVSTGPLGEHVIDV
jgi:adenylosuccinate synthase